MTAQAGGASPLPLAGSRSAWRNPPLKSAPRVAGCAHCGSPSTARATAGRARRSAPRCDRLGIWRRGAPHRALPAACRAKSTCGRAWPRPGVGGVETLRAAHHQPADGRMMLRAAGAGQPAATEQPSASPNPAGRDPPPAAVRARRRARAARRLRPSRQPPRHGRRVLRPRVATAARPRAPLAPTTADRRRVRAPAASSDLGPALGRAARPVVTERGSSFRVPPRHAPKGPPDELLADASPNPTPSASDDLERAPRTRRRRGTACATTRRGT